MNDVMNHIVWLLAVVVALLAVMGFVGLRLSRSEALRRVAHQPASHAPE